MAKSVTIEGVQYTSRTAAAKALVAAGKTLAEAATATGMTYQTVYANTKGAEKVGTRRTKYRVLAMGKTGKRTAGEIAKKCGLSPSKVVAILKGAKITVLTQEAKAATKAIKSGKTPKVKTPKTPKAVAPPAVNETPTPVVVNEDLTDEIPMDAAAEAAAMADMANV